MSDVSTDSQVEFEILLNEIERMATADDVISDGEWADADAGPPPPPAVPAVATTGAPTDTRRQHQERRTRSPPSCMRLRDRAPAPC